MSLIQIEKSSNKGSPIELYKFFSDSFSSPYTYTSAAYSVVYNSETYTPLAELDRSTIELTKAEEGNTISITMTGSNELAKRYIKYLPPKSVMVHIYRKHELDEDNQVVLYWQGKVTSVSHDENIATFNCIPLIAALGKNGLEYNYGAVCQHMVYDSGCKLNINDYTFNATVLQIDGNIISSSTFATFPTTLTAVPEGYWTNGFITRSTGEMKHISGHGSEIGSGYSTSYIKLLTPFEDLQLNEVVTITSGCDNLFSTCLGKYNNTINMLAFPYNSNKNFFTSRIDQ